MSNEPIPLSCINYKRFPYIELRFQEENQQAWNPENLSLENITKDIK